MNDERFEGIRTPRHQTHCRLGIFGVTLHRDLGEVQTIREVQQATHDRPDPFERTQSKGSGEFGRSRRSVPSIASGAERIQDEILEEGKGTDKI
jgi:hypothetical protein